MRTFPIDFIKLMSLLLGYLVVNNKCFNNNKSCFPQYVLSGVSIICMEVESTDLSSELAMIRDSRKDEYANVAMSLQYINFRNPTISKGWLQTTFKLRSLQMNDANVITIEANAFNSEPFHTILHLNLINMPIRVFKTGVFNGLHNLKFISLESVRVFEFGLNVLDPVPKLQTFFMKDCGSQLLNINNLFGMGNMKELLTVNIYGCNLNDTITEKTFSGLYNVNQLVLGSNEIERIGPKSFDYVLVTLSILILDGNYLTTIPKDLFTLKNDRKSKVSVNLFNNPLHCDCNLEHLRAYAQQATMVQFSQMTCASPPKLAGVILQHSEPFCNGSREEVVEEVIDDYKTLQMIEKPPEVKDKVDTNMEDVGKQPNSIDEPIEGLNTVISSEPNPPNPLNSFTPNYLPISPDSQSPPASPISCTSSNSFTVHCEVTHSLPNFLFKKGVTLKKKSNFQLRLEGMNLSINADFASLNFKFIEFESNGRGTAVNCLTNVRRKSNKREKKLKISQQLKPNHLYRFCWIDKRSKLITILDCSTFYSFKLEVAIAPWLFDKDKACAISAVVLISVVAMAIGASVAVLLKIKYPRLIVGKSAEGMEIKRKSVKQATDSADETNATTDIERNNLNL